MPAFATKLAERWRRRYWRASPMAPSDEGLTPFTVITGGSRGIGKALAVEFANAGHHVIIIARGKERLEAARSEIMEATGARVETLSLDITNGDAVAQIDRRLTKLDGFVDIIVNNAAIGLAGPFSEHDDRSVRYLCDLNVSAPTVLMRHYLPGMLARGRGGVLNIASLGGLVPGPYQAAYYASKAYIISLTEAVAHETAGRGVRISVLAPGPVKTDFHKAMGAGSSYYLKFHGVMSVEKIARSAYRGFVWGQTLNVPGFVHKMNAIALRLLPHTLTVPIVGWLLKRR